MELNAKNVMRVIYLCQKKL